MYSVTDANVQIDNPGNVYVYKIDECISALLGCTVAGASIGIDALDGFCTQKDIKKISKKLLTNEIVHAIINNVKWLA